MMDHATEEPSPYDGKYFDKCTGNEIVFGYKARLTFPEMQYVFSDEVRGRASSHTATHQPTHSITRSLTASPTHSSTHPHTHSPTHSLNHSLTHSLTN